MKGRPVMDINTLRSISTVLAFAAFIGIVAWAWSRRNQAGFELRIILGETKDEILHLFQDICIG